MKEGGQFNYVALVAALFAVFIAVIILTRGCSTDSGSVGLGEEVLVGEKAAPFAVPLAETDLDGDANVDPEAACSVEGDDVLRICDFFGRPLVMSFWFTKGASSCIDQQDVFEEVASRFGDRAGFVSINVRDDRDRVRELIRERGWNVPVGYDRDGAVSNMYRVGGCPTFLFFRTGGVLESAEIGDTTPEELGAQVRSLIDGRQEPQQETTQSETATPGG